MNLGHGKEPNMEVNEEGICSLSSALADARCGSSNPQNSLGIPPLFWQNLSNVDLVLVRESCARKARKG
jgi:hypothetical protein